MEQPLDALLVFSGLYYLLNFNHPHKYETGLTVLHCFIIDDRSIQGDMLESFNIIFEDYNMLKTDLFIILLANCWYLWIGLWMNHIDLF